MEVGQQLIVHAIYAHLAGSSSSSESYDSQDVWNLIYKRREATNLYYDVMCEVGRLELCLNAVKTTLSTSKEETNVAQMRANEAHARAVGKISLKSFSFYIHNFIR